MALKAHCAVLEGGHLLPWVGVSAPWCTQTSILKLIKASIPYLARKDYSQKVTHLVYMYFTCLFIFDYLIDPPADQKRITLY